MPCFSLLYICTLAKKEMVKGFPNLQESQDVCMVAKPIGLNSFTHICVDLSTLLQMVVTSTLSLSLMTTAEPLVYFLHENAAFENFKRFKVLVRNHDII
ncbi:hypothetical protein QL285_060885 [Trifolium repens]|nr:hypothetical protein QL285_060885 [Trifolium repens]